MGDAAHAESLDHEVFSRPFKVDPKFSFRKTPGNYRRYPDGDKLPDEMKIWFVQTTGKKYGGVVARSYGFTDSPDAEVIVLGVNRGKEYGAVGIGRHANFLQWGYSASPSKMTEAGQKLFLNCISYIHKFDDKVPLIRRTASDRMNAIRLAAIIDRISGDKKKFFTSSFPSELWEKYGSNPNALVKYYRENMEFIYRDRTYCIDSELKSLGIGSNRELDTLERLIGLLQDDRHAGTARRLLARYTDQSFGSEDQWQSWLQTNKDRIYFTDVGGYKFLVVPKGYSDGG